MDGISSVSVREGFRWDGCDAYLFDIDGTLLHAHGGVHTGAFSSSVAAVMGHPLPIDSVPVHGSTDTGILRDAFRLAAIPDEVVDSLVVHGSFEQCRAHVGRYVAHGVDIPVMAVIPVDVSLDAAIKGLAPPWA